VDNAGGRRGRAAHRCWEGLTPRRSGRLFVTGTSGQAWQPPWAVVLERSHLSHPQRCPPRLHVTLYLTSLTGLHARGTSPAFGVFLQRSSPLLALLSPLSEWIFCFDFAKLGINSRKRADAKGEAQWLSRTPKALRGPPCTPRAASSSPSHSPAAKGSSFAILSSLPVCWHSSALRP